MTAPLGATPEDICAARRGRFQRRAVSRDRAADGAMAGEDPRPAVHADRSDRRRRDARVHRRGRGARRARSRPRRGAKETRACRGIRARSTRPISPASASSSSATRPMRSPRRASPRTDSASRSSAWEPTPANSPARSAKPRRRYDVERADHRRLPRSRGEDRRSCSPNSCSARRWSGTSPSAWAFPAR